MGSASCKLQMAAGSDTSKAPSQLPKASITVAWVQGDETKGHSGHFPWHPSTEPVLWRSCVIGGVTVLSISQNTPLVKSTSIFSNRSQSLSYFFQALLQPDVSQAAVAIWNIKQDNYPPQPSAASRSLAWGRAVCHTPRSPPTALLTLTGRKNSTKLRQIKPSALRRLFLRITNTTPVLNTSQ